MIDKNGSIGIAGALFVAGELTRRGFVASLTSKNTKLIDLLVSDKSGSKTVAIQVKTCNSLKQKRWKMSSKVETEQSDNLFFVFVNLNEGNQPDYYVVPSKVVVEHVREDYEKWYKTPAKDGAHHNPTSMRTFSFRDDEKKRYQNNWDILGINETL